MPYRDFDLKALYDALEERCRERGMTWSTVAKEVNRHRTTGRPIAVSTITGLRQKAVGEGEVILQMILWLKLIFTDSLSFKTFLGN
ncbi:MAG TPA: hypothetical protein VKN18_09000 [Blastocatellia bacterium]|nr:hypothetical protein [Blastocatellia bacterium]